MRREIELAAEQQKFYSIPVREEALKPTPTRDEIVSRRRTIRVTTDDLIEKGILGGDIVAFSAKIVDQMLTMGGTCAQFGIRPEISDFLVAIKELIEETRGPLDRALIASDWDAVKVGIARMQAILGGVCFVLGLPYVELLETIHAAYMAGGAPTDGVIRDVLRAKGFAVDAAANEEPKEN